MAMPRLFWYEGRETSAWCCGKHIDWQVLEGMTGKSQIFDSARHCCSREYNVKALNSKPLKIGLIHKRLDLNGGTERDLFLTALGLRDLGHEIHLFCNECTVQAPAGISVHHVALPPLGRTARLWSFAIRAPKIADAYHCDIVIGFGRILKQDLLRSGGGSHRGFLQRLGNEGGWRRRLWQRVSVYHRSVLAIERRQFERGQYKKILAVSEEAKRDLMMNYQVPEHCITVLYNGVDQSRFHPQRRDQAHAVIRERWRIPAHVSLVLFVGNGFRRKGLDRLLSIWDSDRLKDTWLLVVGDDARIARYKAWANRVGQGRVIFTGRQSDIENYYAAADLLALPAVQEAFGNVILEALSSGLPVLVSREVGAVEVLSGALLEGVIDRPDDPADLENRLLKLLKRKNDPEFKRTASLIGAEFSWPNYFRRLEKILSRVAREKSADHEIAT
jgi:UDP-glucose:(heptosyl)LPS alpha-1,3-glucosyltransferase